MKIDQIFSYIGIAVIAFAIGYFLAPKKPSGVVVEYQEKIVQVPEYIDTCYAVQIDSFEIYRTIRKGLPKRTANILPDTSYADVGDTTKTMFSYNDALLNIVTEVSSDGEVFDISHETTLDTFEIVRLFRIVDSFPVYTPPIIITETKTVTVIETFTPTAFGISVEAGSSFNDVSGKARAGAGLFYQDRKLRRYEAVYSSDEVFSVRFSAALFKSKK